MDASKCSPSDQMCVTVLKNIEALKLQYEKEQLNVALDRARLDYYVSSPKITADTFEAQYATGWILLALVITVVGAGLAMSWRQLNYGLQNGQFAEQKFEFSTGTIKVQSTVIGLVIFLASIVFFTIYIDKVYPRYRVETQPVLIFSGYDRLPVEEDANLASRKKHQRLVMVRTLPPPRSDRSQTLYSSKCRWKVARLGAYTAIAACRRRPALAKRKTALAMALPARPDPTPCGRTRSRWPAAYDKSLDDS